MKRKLYHGSENIIEKPIYGYGKKNNDYGSGFYCTEDEELAFEWAVHEEQDGYSNTYIIDEKGLKILNLTNENFTSLNWIELLLRNRTFDLITPIAKESAKYLHEQFYTDISDVDVIIGYRADDSYFTYAQDFLNNSISCGQLSDALRLGNLGLQYVLKSEKAFNQIKYISSQKAKSEEWYPRKQMRDKKARREYYNMDIRKYIKDDLYMIQILDKEITGDDLCLR